MGVKEESKRCWLTSPNRDPQSCLLPQNTQESHKQGPLSPSHISLQALQHSSEEFSLKSDPHFIASPHSSKCSTPPQHPSPSRSSSLPLQLSLEPTKIVSLFPFNETEKLQQAMQQEIAAIKKRTQSVKRCKSESVCLRPISLGVELTNPEMDSPI